MNKTKTLVLVAHPHLADGSRVNARWALELQKHPESIEVRDLAAEIAANDGIIDKHNALAADSCGYGVELDPNELFTLVLFRLNEGSADIFVFDKAYAVGNAGLS